MNEKDRQTGSGFMLIDHAAKNISIRLTEGEDRARVRGAPARTDRTDLSVEVWEQLQDRRHAVPAAGHPGGLAGRRSDVSEQRRRVRHCGSTNAARWLAEGAQAQMSWSTWRMRHTRIC